MTELNQLVVFTLDEQRYALRLATVERIVRAVEITQLPRAPEIVLGVVNMQGRVVSVVNIRKRFRLPERTLEPSDRLIFAQTSRRTVALVADAVSGVVECSKNQVTGAAAVLSGLQYVAGVAKLEDGLVLIHDLDKFLSLEEEEALDEVLEKTSR